MKKRALVQSLGPMVIIMALAVGFAGRAAADFASELARALNANPDYFVLNLPPIPSAAPGSVYTSDRRFVIAPSEITDPSLLSGPEFDLQTVVSVDLKAGAKAGLYGLFRVSASVENEAIAAVRFTGAKIYDLTLGEARKRLLSASLSANAQRAIIISRAYVGRPTLVLSRKNGLNAEAWAKVQNSIAQVGADVAEVSDSSLALKTRQDVIFAYEIARAIDLTALQKIEIRIQALQREMEAQPGPGPFMQGARGSLELMQQQSLDDQSLASLFSNQAVSYRTAVTPVKSSELPSLE